MDSSRRAVESYWRSRMIDGATSDEDKVTPVYKLEEICELLRSSHSSIVKEVSGFILKRLDHKSPIVKQKGLRVIKYAVGKSGVEFRREMQRNSVAIRQLIHYKGQVDPLKGDALNKAVRATAQEALSAIFSAEENSQATTAVAPPAEHLTKRIQGFGNTNYEPPSSDDKKSFLSEVVGIGSATIKQGFNSLTQSPSLKKNNDTGSYRSPNLRRSLTTEIDQSDRYEGYEHHSEPHPPTRLSNSSTTGTWGQNFVPPNTESSNGSSYSSNNNNNNSREERLLETIVTSGGVRLQPTRDALQVFLREAPKLDALALSHALELKLQSHLWQVRVKAVCVLEAILRKKDDENLAIIAAYFSGNKDIVVKCSESPQASLREKANKVLSLLDPGEGSGGAMPVNEEKGTSNVNVVQFPDLIDTGDSDDLYNDGGANQSINQIPNSSPLIDDLFSGGDSSNGQKNDDSDPFADVSFHINNDKKQRQQHSLLVPEDPFTGLNVDDKPGGANKIGPQLFDDIFGSSSEPLPPQPPVEVYKEVYSSKNINDLMGEMSINKPNNSPVKLQSSDVSSGMQPPPASVFPLGYNLPSGTMLNSAFPSQPLTNYGAIGNIFAQQQQLQMQQQQLLATMSNFQQLGNLHSQNAMAATVLPSHYSTPGGIQAAPTGGGYVSALPDIFNPTIPVQAPTSTMMNNSKKEDTRAFDFISDHLASARDPKRVV